MSGIFALASAHSRSPRGTVCSQGNGAPDIVSVIIGVVHGSTGISIGIPLGAGIFLTNLVLAIVSVVANTWVTRRPFLRDSIFYLVSLIYVYVTCLDGSISLGESTVYLVYYCVYVAVVVIGRVVFQLHKKKKKARLAAAQKLVQNEGETHRDKEGVTV